MSGTCQQAQVSTLEILNIFLWLKFSPISIILLTSVYSKRGLLWQANVSRPLQNGTFCPLSASGSNFIPRNILYIPVVEIFAFLELKQKLLFFKGLGVLKSFFSF
jgi:hypothetical protein